MPPVLHTPETEVPWDLLIKAGRIDPAPAPADDPEGYEALMREAVRRRLQRARSRRDRSTWTTPQAYVCFSRRR